MKQPNLVYLLLTALISSLNHAHPPPSPPTTADSQEFSTLAEPLPNPDGANFVDGVGSPPAKSDTESLEAGSFKSTSGDGSANNVKKTETPANSSSRKKRFSNFVRIGRAGTFLPIGKSHLQDNLMDDFPDDGFPSRFAAPTKRQMHRFIRIGRGMGGGGRLGKVVYADSLLEKPLEEPWSSYLGLDDTPSSFSQLGTVPLAEPGSYYQNDFSGAARLKRSVPSDVAPLKNLVKAIRRASSFVRIGKRPSSFVRIGKNPSKFVTLGQVGLKNQVLGVYGDEDEGGAGESEPFDFSPDDSTHGFPRFAGPANSVENQPLAKRKSRFLRIGRSSVDRADAKRNSKFVRIGKSFVGEPGLKRQSNFVRIGKSDADGVESKRNSNFVRIGKSHFDDDDEIKRASNFVRIGKSMFNDDDDDYGDNTKRASSFVRIGKSRFGGDDSYNNDLKRASSFVRIGKGDLDGEDTKRGSSFVRNGKSDFYNDNTKRASRFVRIGKNDLDNDNPKRASSFVRIGKSGFNDDDNKRTSSFVRIGKSHVDDNDSKRASSFVRIGKNYFDNDNVKRASSFVRIGKLGSNPDSLDNFDKNGDNLERGSERGFARTGKSSAREIENAPLDEKRAGSGGMEPEDGDGFNSDMVSQKKGFAPVDKGGDTGGKAGQEESFLDGNTSEDQGPISIKGRGSAFVRIGKIPSSAFVRIGKNTDVMVEQDPGRVFQYSRGARGGQSSFVRIGK